MTYEYAFWGGFLWLMNISFDDLEPLMHLLKMSCALEMALDMNMIFAIWTDLFIS